MLNKCWHVKIAKIMFLLEVSSVRVIHSYDIDQDNNINSAQMSDARILYRSEGDVDRATKQGWGTKIVQAVWPF